MEKIIGGSGATNIILPNGMNKITDDEPAKVSTSKEQAAILEGLSKAVDKKEFDEQLKEFSNEDFSGITKGIDIKDGNYVIKVFVYEDKSMPSTSSLFMYDERGNLTTIKDSGMNKSITHMAKVLAVGEAVDSPKYKVGEIVLLPHQVVTGTDLNPLFVQALQYSRSFGGEQPIVPEGTPEMIPAIQAHWREHFFTRPEDFNKECHNIYEFAIPEYKIVAKYNV